MGSRNIIEGVITMVIYLWDSTNIKKFRNYEWRAFYNNVLK